MFISIYENRSGAEYVRRLAPNESLDIRAHVHKWAEREGYLEAGLRPSFSEAGSHIANGCGEYQAEIRRTKQAFGSCWESEPFFMIGEE